MVHAEKMPRGLILLNMAFDKIGKGGGGEKARLDGWRAQFWLHTWNQKDFFRSSSGKFSSAAPINGDMATAVITLMRSVLLMGVTNSVIIP
jgi:hypothetical protein